MNAIFRGGLLRVQKVKVASAKNPVLSNIVYVKPGVGRNIQNISGP